MQWRTFLNGLAMVSVVVTLSGCIPPRDILSDWTGIYVIVDDRGATDRGCRVDGTTRRIEYWWYETDGSVGRDVRDVERFALTDLYSQNYGTFDPTWIYRYDLEGGGAFLLQEYYNGDIAPYIVVPDSSSPMPCREVGEIPPLFELASIPDDNAALRELIGAYAHLSGSVVVAERSTSSGYPGATGLFGEGFIDTVELAPVEAPAWTIIPRIRSEVRPVDEMEHVTLAAPGDAVDRLCRLTEIHQDPSRGDRSVILVFNQSTSPALSP